MNFRKYLTFLLALCVAFSAMASNVAPLADAAPKNAAAMAMENHSGCHSALDAPVSGQHDEGANNSGNAGNSTAHVCCVNFVAPVSSLCFAHAPRGASEIIAFKPPFILLARSGGIYRPPRQNS